MSGEHMVNFATFHRQWWRLHSSEKISSGTYKQKIQGKVDGITVQTTYSKPFTRYYSTNHLLRTIQNQDILCFCPFSQLFPVYVFW